MASDAPEARIAPAGLSVEVLQQCRANAAIILVEATGKAQSFEAEQSIERTFAHGALRPECKSVSHAASLAEIVMLDHRD